jgi:serine/threonine-protein kinase RsbW
MESDFSRTLSDGRPGLPALMDAIEAHLAAAGAPLTAIAPVLIALDEVMANVVDYGGEGGASPLVEVAVRVSDGRIAVEVSDDGRPFNPVDAATPDTRGALEERPIGGLGIHLVKTLMDTVDYQHSGGRNHLRFSRVYSGPSAS